MEGWATHLHKALKITKNVDLTREPTDTWLHITLTYAGGQSLVSGEDVLIPWLDNHTQQYNWA